MSKKKSDQASLEDTSKENKFNLINKVFELTNRIDYLSDIGGILLLAWSLMTALVILYPEYTDGLLLIWGEILSQWMGWGAFWMAIIMFFIALWMLRQRTKRISGQSFLGKLIFLELISFSSLSLMSLLAGQSLERAEAGLDGGRIGWGLSELLLRITDPTGVFGPFISAILLIIISLASLFFGLGFYKPIFFLATKALEFGRVDREKQISSFDPIISEAPLDGAGKSIEIPRVSNKKRVFIPPEFRKSFRFDTEKTEHESHTVIRDERLPGLDLLSTERSHRPNERNINMTAGLIEKTLAEFGIPSRVVGFQVGPTVTQFAVEPGFHEKDSNGEQDDEHRRRVRVSQISSLRRDLALALSAERLRIQAPVPGRPYVGIEVPNPQATVVRLRSMLESESFYKLNSPLAISLGRDVSGQPVVADLSQMPHLLIAGTTGSGKSVGIAAITTCLVMNNTPEDLRLVMIDPKMVELVRFNGLPHLYGNVETNLDRILAVLRWVVVEMDRRYKVLELSRSRNIDTYNRKARRKKGVEILPRIVVMIDELADLMMSAPDQTEHNLVRLAQMARATGIHLVVATQRPSTDIVTGLIKANFPTRISFAVASSIDSRVILDTVGAEHLLGKGDMLFLPPEASLPIRLQGIMVSDQEVERVINFWQISFDETSQQVKAPWDEMIEEEQILADRDDLLEKALELVRKTQRVSASLLQRRLRIGYPRAARLIDQLQDMGVVGPSSGGGKDREVLIMPEDDDEE
jgi:DNA segregation ATPase FtsK/SpoIIIE, S-DNA-T family